MLDDADVVAMLQAMAIGIRDRGKAEPGQKTMLDAWAPAAQAAAEAQAAGKDLAGCLDAAVAAAREGAEATTAMVAEQGAGGAAGRAGARSCRSRRGVGGGGDRGDAAEPGGLGISFRVKG